MSWYLRKHRLTTSCLSRTTHYNKRNVSIALKPKCRAAGVSSLLDRVQYRGEGGIMKLLLTSGGISNRSIHDALVDLLGKPIAEASALFVPTAIYAMSVGPDVSARMILGKVPTPL